MKVWCPSDHSYCQKVGLPRRHFRHGENGSRLRFLEISRKIPRYRAKNTVLGTYRRKPVDFRARIHPTLKGADRLGRPEKGTNSNFRFSSVQTERNSWSPYEVSLPEGGKTVSGNGRRRRRAEFQHMLVRSCGFIWKPSTGQSPLEMFSKSCDNFCLQLQKPVRRKQGHGVNHTNIHMQKGHQRRSALELGSTPCGVDTIAVLVA